MMPRWVLLAVLPLCWTQSREISGIVVDAQGKPIPGVWIWNAGSQDHSTRADGTFLIRTEASAVVFRHQNFASVFRRSEGLKGAQIRMLPVSPKLFPVCRGHHFDKTTNALRFSFNVPDTPGISRLAPASDIDYTTRSYRLNANRSAVMLHGRGYAWSTGFPLDSVVSASVEYDESVFEFGAIRIVDARGRTADEKRWRFLGRFTETISYGPLPPNEAAIFDRAIDGVCAGN